MSSRESSGESNIKTKVDGNILTIVIDLSKRLGNSKSGKSTIVASTLGNAAVPGADPELRIGINCYLPAAK